MTSPGHRSVGVSVEVEAFRRADVSAHDALQATCPALRDRHLDRAGLSRTVLRDVNDLHHPVDDLRCVVAVAVQESPQLRTARQQRGVNV